MKTKMTVCLLVILALLAAPLKAQDKTEGVQFVEGKTFAEVVAMAKASGKMVFLDCYTSWCGPCRMMTNNVFPQKVVGDYMNEEFVNVKIDMEKGEGPELGKRLQVRAYPTFVMFDGDGNEIGRMVGGLSKGEDFVKAVKECVGEKSLSAMNKRYDNGERSKEFLLDYIEVLDKAYNSDKAGQVFDELIQNKESEMLGDDALFSAFLKYNSSPLTPAFQYVLNNKSDFLAKYDAKKVERVLASNWMTYPRSLVKKNADGTVIYDKEAMKAYIKEMKKWKVENIDEIVLLSDINVAEATKDWTSYAKYCTKYFKKFGDNDMYIYNWAMKIERNSEDPKVRATAVKWMERRIEFFKAEEAKLPPLKEGEVRPMSMMNYTSVYEKMIEKLK